MTHKVEWSKFQKLPKCCRISNLETSPPISSRYVISRLDFSFWFRGTCVTSVQLRRCRAHWSRTSSPPRLDVGEAGQVQPVLLCPSLSRCSSLCFSRYSSPGIPAVHSCILTIRFRIQPLLPGSYVVTCIARPSSRCPAVAPPSPSPSSSCHGPSWFRCHLQQEGVL